VLLFFLETGPTAQRPWLRSVVPGPRETPAEMFRSRWMLAIRQAAARYRCIDGYVFLSKAGRRPRLVCAGTSWRAAKLPPVKHPVCGAMPRGTPP
jgi:rubredoxin